MFSLQIIPLSKQLTNIAGSLWSRTLKTNRAERVEYLLTHEFHKLKYITPEKKKYADKKVTDEDGNVVAGPRRGKSKYGGGKLSSVIYVDTA
jgi:DNA polymerase alpha subunit A